MIAFLDTSALAKRYLAEPGSEVVRRLFRGRRERAVSRLALAELAAALARACREAAITAAQRDAVMARLPADFAALHVVEARAAVVDRVPGLVVRHPLRAYDALQLASALLLRDRVAVEFWTADEVQARAAQGEGLKTVWLDG